MAYQIRYTDSMVVEAVSAARKPVFKWLAVVCAVMLVVGLLQLEAVQNFLIPGNPDVTRAAFSLFTQELRAGERFQDAAVAFCRQIIDSEQFE